GAGGRGGVGRIHTTNDPGGRLVSKTEQSAAKKGKPFNYQRDVAPWLGKQAGFFFTSFGVSPDGAGVIETTNSNSALNFARQQEGDKRSAGLSTPNGGSFQTSQRHQTPAFAPLDIALVADTESRLEPQP